MCSGMKKKFSAAAVLSAQSLAGSATEAARAFGSAVQQARSALVLFFCSAAYDLDALAAELRRQFHGTPVVGCSAAGEFGPAGWSAHAITGASFDADRFTVTTCRLADLQRFDAAAGQAAVQQALQALERQAPGAHAGNTFAFLMIDGLGGREEPVARALQSALGQIPLVGGSASDGQGLGRTWVYTDGAFHADSAVLVLVSTALPFRPFMTHHFQATGQRLVVTSADPARRIVHEIDGRPAAQAYAAYLGVTPDQLAPALFAASPLAVMIGGASYVRSIAQALADGSLLFHCAIEEGMVLRITCGTDLVDNLERALGRLRANLGQPLIVLGGDCILRRVEMVQRGLTDKVAALMQSHRVCAFNTYGEQYRGVHVNQTFAGIAIGEPSSDA